MHRQPFYTNYYPLACEAGKQLGLNPVVILAQAALETGWGQSNLCRFHHNFFGITAAGRPNDFWNGQAVQLASGSLKFRKYEEPLQSFMDYARLITANYKQAAAVSAHPKAFAQEIAYSRYISEVNGDDREAYRKSIISIASWIENMNERENPPTTNY